MSNLSAQEPDDNPDAALKRRLLNRIAIAAVMVVGLLGSLAMFDAINTPTTPVPAKVVSLPTTAPDRQAAAEPASEPVKEPAPAAPASETAPATAPASATTPATTTEPARKEPPAVPEATTTPGAPALQPLPAEKPLTKPAVTRPALARPTTPMTPPAAPAAPVTRPDPARELVRDAARDPARISPAPQAARRAPASRPITQAAERQFALQMGVFSNAANAEDLRAKLELNGIPASIEARVHAGPFASREEADAARTKLRELGLDGGLLITMKK